MINSDDLWLVDLVVAIEASGDHELAAWMVAHAHRELDCPSLSLQELATAMADGYEVAN